MRTVCIQGTEILVNGKATRFRSGSMHYFRIHPDLWEDRLLKLKQCGLNTVETYLPWNLHEEEEGEFNFTGMLDFERYVRLAASLGLMVRCSRPVNISWISAWVRPVDRM